MLPTATLQYEPSFPFPVWCPWTRGVSSGLQFHAGDESQKFSGLPVLTQTARTRPEFGGPSMAFGPTGRRSIWIVLRISFNVLNVTRNVCLQPCWECTWNKVIKCWLALSAAQQPSQKISSEHMWENTTHQNLELLRTRRNINPSLHARPGMSPSLLTRSRFTRWGMVRWRQHALDAKGLLEYSVTYIGIGKKPNAKRIIISLTLILLQTWSLLSGTRGKSCGESEFLSHFFLQSHNTVSL